jgi:hypothetical protein
MMSAAWSIQAAQAVPNTAEFEVLGEREVVTVSVVARAQRDGQKMSWPML